MTNGTYPFLVAMKRIDEGWDADHIDSELMTRLAFLDYPEQTLIGFMEHREDDLN